MIILPWPPKELSPNARPHFHVKARATKAYRETAHWATIAASVTAPEGGGDIPITVEFRPKSRRPDRQNMPGWIKAGIDGIADALNVNDRRFNPTYIYSDPVEGGEVRVTIG